MEVRIGVQSASRELSIDADMDADAVQERVTKALESGGLLTLTDARGRRVVVPVEKLAYVEIASATAGQVGFRS
jgi:hypothetical protein